MFELAEYFIGLHNPNHTDYLKKYGTLEKPDTAVFDKAAVSPDQDVEQRPVYIELKKYRLQYPRGRVR